MVLAKKEEISVLFLSTRWNSSRLLEVDFTLQHPANTFSSFARITFQAVRHVHIQYKPSYVLDLSFSVAYGCSIDILLTRFCYPWSQHVDYCIFVNGCYSSCWFLWLVGYILSKHVIKYVFVTMILNSQFKFEIPDNCNRKTTIWFLKPFSRKKVVQNLALASVEMAHNCTPVNKLS